MTSYFAADTPCFLASAKDMDCLNELREFKKSWGKNQAEQPAAQALPGKKKGLLSIGNLW